MYYLFSKQKDYERVYTVGDELIFVFLGNMNHKYKGVLKNINDSGTMTIGDLRVYNKGSYDEISGFFSVESCDIDEVILLNGKLALSNLFMLDEVGVDSILISKKSQVVFNPGDRVGLDILTDTGRLEYEGILKGISSKGRELSLSDCTCYEYLNMFPRRKALCFRGSEKRLQIKNIEYMWFDRNKGKKYRIKILNARKKS